MSPVVGKNRCGRIQDALFFRREHYFDFLDHCLVRKANFCITMSSKRNMIRFGNLLCYRSNVPLGYPFIFVSKQGCMESQ
jgi:hypothetical protein